MSEGEAVTVEAVMVDIVVRALVNDEDADLGAIDRVRLLSMRAHLEWVASYYPDLNARVLP